MELNVEMSWWKPSNDELRVAYLCHSEMDIAVDMAQMEWVARKVEITSDHHLQILYIILYL